MSSGAFKVEEIEAISQQAFQTFVNLFGVPDPEAPRVPQQAPPARWPTGDKIDTASVAPPAKSYGAPVAQEPGPVDGKDFRVWANDKIKLGKKIGPGNKPWGEVTWAEAHQHLARGSAQVRGYLSFLANLADKDPQYAASNARMRGRAQSLLDSIPEQQREEAPF
jgi:hypothetical protein